MSFLTLVAQTAPNTYLGYLSGATGRGVSNTAFGEGTLQNIGAGVTNAGAGNVAIGKKALNTNIVGNSNVAIGFEALLNATNSLNTAIGNAALQALTSGNTNVALGSAAGLNLTTGSGNAFLGYQCGTQMTTGSKNSILGSFSGNQGGLDIRTASNYIVLSDGDGNPRLWIDNTGAASIPGGVVFPSGTANGVLFLNGSKVVSSGNRLTFDGTNTMRIGGGVGGYIQGLTTERLAAEDATGFFYAWGGGVNPAVPVNIGNTGTTDFVSRAAAAGGSFQWLLGVGEQMRLNSTGLGIGTTPQRTLHVFTATAETQVMIESTSEQAVRFTRSGVGNLMFGRDSSNNFVFADGFQFSAATRLLTLTSTGNLGLGVTPSGNYLLQAGSNASAAARGFNLMTVRGGYSGSDYPRIGYNFRTTTTNGSYLFDTNDFSSSIKFQSGGFQFFTTAVSGTTGNAIPVTQAMTLDESGRLMLGTTTPSGLVTFNGNSTGAVSVYVLNTNSGGSASSRLYLDTNGGATWIENKVANGALVLSTNGNDRLTVTQNGNISVGTAALATTATDGFFYIPGCAGTPTGVPTTFTGRAPIVVDTTNNKLYFYSGGAWRDAGP